MYKFGKSTVNSKVFQKSLNRAKKNYQQKNEKTGEETKKNKGRQKTTERNES